MRELRLAAAVTLAAIVTLSLAPAPSSAAVRPLVTGISDFESTNLADQVVFDRIRAAGARFVRISLTWRSVAPLIRPPIWDPTNPADLNYRWGNVDTQVREAVGAGLTPLVQIYTAPEWAERCRIDSGRGAPCDPRPEDVSQFATAAARRYSGAFGGLPRVRYWELFNEPNLDYYFNPQFRDGRPVSPDLYRALLRAFAPAINSVSSSNLIVGPGMAPIGVPGDAIAPLNFMRRLLCMRGLRHPRPAGNCDGKIPFDVWTTNPYTAGGPTHRATGPNDVSLGDLPEMMRLLRASERAGRIESELHPVPFWITEFSWDSKPPDPGGLSPRILARWSAEAMYRAWRAGISKFFWLGIRDEANPQNKPSWLIENSGLYLRGQSLADDKPKRVLYAFRFPFVAFRDKAGVRVWGRIPTSSRGTVEIQVRRSGRWRRLAMLDADRSGIFGGVLPTRYGHRKRGLVRARAAGTTSLPFSLHYVGDFFAPPFGLAPGEAHVPQRSEAAQRW